MNKNKIIFILMILPIIYGYSDDFINQEFDKQNEIIDKIEFQILDMNETIKALKSDNIKGDLYITELEKGFNKINEGLLMLKENNESFSNLTNNINVSEIISAVDRVIEDVDRMNNQKKLVDKFVQVLIPVSSVPIIIGGIYIHETTDKKLLGKSMIIYGSGLLISGEFLWNSGKMIFKIW